MAGKFLTDSVIYKSFLGENENYEPIYEDFNLDGVAVKEKIALSEEERDEARTAVYFLYHGSVCSKNGVEFPFPEVKIGDLVQIGERLFRVAEAVFHESRGRLSHIRLMLS